MQPKQRDQRGEDLQRAWCDGPAAQRVHSTNGAIRRSCRRQRSIYYTAGTQLEPEQPWENMTMSLLGGIKLLPSSNSAPQWPSAAAATMQARCSSRVGSDRGSNIAQDKLWEDNCRVFLARGSLCFSISPSYVYPYKSLVSAPTPF